MRRRDWLPLLALIVLTVGVFYGCVARLFSATWFVVALVVIGGVFLCWLAIACAVVGGRGRQD